MLRRRDFLQQSVTVATVASAGMLAARSGRNAAPMIPAVHAPNAVRFVIFDEDFEDSVSFGRELASRGAQAFPVQQDIGRLWFGELGSSFAAGAAIAGLTSHSELLVCAMFARQYGARVRYEGAHDCRGNEVLTHCLRVSAADCGLGQVLAAADADWPRVLASQLVNLQMNATALRENRLRTTTRRSATHPGSLFSWVIA